MVQTFLSLTSRCVETLVTEHDRLWICNFTIPHMHKLLGIACLAHFLYRFFLAFTYGSMFFDPDSIITWLTPAVHLTLPLSSFIFPVPVRRFGSKPIIWKELQLHNILFGLRSCLLFWLWTIQACTNEHFTLRLFVIMGTHYVADLVTDAYQDLGRTTTRDMPWGEDVPKWIPNLAKKYYAVCQLLATTALLAQGAQMLDAAFSILFPIQISAFLMTLVRKNLINSTQWHLYYAISLGMVFWLPISTLVRTAYAAPVLGYDDHHRTSVAKVISIVHLSLGPLAAFFRMGLRLNKHAIFVFITGVVILLSTLEREGSFSSALTALQKSATGSFFPARFSSTLLVAGDAVIGFVSSPASIL